MPARNVPFKENGSSCMIAMKITLTKNRQYGGSGEMACFTLSAKMFVTAAPPVTELLETVMRVLNDCSRFYPHANRNMADNLIVRRDVAVDSVHRLGQRCPSEC